MPQETIEAPEEMIEAPVAIKLRDNTLCPCLACMKKAGYPGHSDHNDFRSAGVWHGTRRWDAKGRGPLYLGMELELSGAGTNAWRHAVSYLGGPALAEVKPDCSMMEMTSHPMSLPYFMNHYPWQLLTELEAMGVRAYPDSGGIHVHVNKTAFTSTVHVYNWLTLYYLNPQEMTHIGGRSSNYHFLSPPSRRGRENVAQVTAAASKVTRTRHIAAAHSAIRNGRTLIRRSDLTRISAAQAERAMMRYSESESGTAINAHRHENTFEVRFPGASTDPAVVKSRLQLIAAGYAYTRTLTGTSDSNLRFDLFRDWVNSTRRYPQLAAVMAGM
jgi:hypothetical protein